MKYEFIPRGRVLAIDPTTKGFGFVLLETDPLQLVDWGTKLCRRTEQSLGAAVAAAVRRYRPTVVLVESPNGARSPLRQAVLVAVVDILDRGVLPRGVPLQAIDTDRVRTSFRRLGMITKCEITQYLAALFPELEACVPPQRQIWQSEDSRQAIFDSLALALAAGSPHETH